MRPSQTLSVLILSLSILHFGPASGQTSIWNLPQDKLGKVREKGQKQVSKWKQWKKHVAEWGLDSNYRYALSASGRLYTNGWGVGLCYLLNEEPGRKTLWQLHFAELKHEKETKLQQTGKSSPELGKNTAYIFGKINNAYTLQLAYGREQMLLPALIDGNFSVSLRYSGGPALAMLKPYYLNLIYVNYTPEPVAHIQTERYTDLNKDHFLQSGFIQGSASWSKGLRETKFIPGIFVELAFALESYKPKGLAQVITIGGNAAFYTSKIEIMAERKSYPYQASFFVGLSIGKRWR